MMTYVCDWVENKKPDWKVVTIREITEGGATYTDVSINKVDRKGVTFQDFDAIAPGTQVTGNIWRSSTGKYTLFAPDAPKAAAPAVPGAPAYAAPRPAATGMRGVAAAQERKAEGIALAQENKSKGMLVAAAFRDSTLMLVNMADYKTMTPDEVKIKHKALRDWYIAEYHETEKKMDTPF